MNAWSPKARNAKVRILFILELQLPKLIFLVRVAIHRLYACVLSVESFVVKMTDEAIMVCRQDSTDDASLIHVCYWNVLVTYAYADCVNLTVWKSDFADIILNGLKALKALKPLKNEKLIEEKESSTQFKIEDKTMMKSKMFHESFK